MDKINISEKDYRDLYKICSKILRSHILSNELNDKAYIDEKTENEYLTSIFKSDLINHLPFNDKELFIDLFKYSLIKTNHLIRLSNMSEFLYKTYEELDTENEYSKNIFSCLAKINILEPFLENRDVKYLLSLFNNKKYLSYLLTYMFNNIERLDYYDLRNFIIKIIKIRDKFNNEEDFYKTCIYIIKEKKRYIKFESNFQLEHYLYSIDNKESFNDDKLIDEYNKQSMLIDSIEEQLAASKDEIDELNKRYSESIRMIMDEIHSTNQYLTDKEKEQLILRSENQLIDLSYKKLINHNIDNYKISSNFYKYFINAFLLENRINDVAAYRFEEIQVQLIKELADTLKLNLIIYNDSNISRFFNDETLDIYINGGILCFEFYKIDETKQAEIIDKINSIRNKIYYNNQFYKENKLFKIVILSNKELKLNNFVTTKVGTTPKRRIR